MPDYEVEVLVRGRPVKVFKHKGDHFIEGRKGSVFELKITNNTWDRIEVVASVDGLSVINGEECGPDSEGYVVPARGSVIIPGWKLPDDKAAQFVFEDKRDGYSNQVGKGTTNVGVIGVMVFEEKPVEKPVVIPTPQPYPVPYPVPTPDPWYPRPWRIYPDNIWYGSGTGDNTAIRGISTSVGSKTVTSNNVLETFGSNSVADSETSFTATSNDSIGATLQNSGVETANMIQAEADVAESLFEIGTGWGKEINHEVTMVEFTRKDNHNPSRILSLFYDTKKGLEARGIEVVKSTKKKVNQLPNAFPIYKNTGCKPPKNWKG